MRVGVSRRQWLRASAGAVAATAAQASLAADAAPGKVLVFLRLRGGADGFSLVVPYTNESYYRLRPRTAIEHPERGAGAAVALNDRYALHPALGGWKALYDLGELGIVLDVGLLPAQRSHRVAQRALDAAIMRVAAAPEPEVLAGALSEQLSHLATVFRAGTSPACVLLESLGWDTHMAQGSGRAGRLAALAGELGSGVLAFRTALGDAWKRVVLFVVTEFGRTLAESSLHGTEDAHGAVLFAFGATGGGRVWGSYPTAADDGLCARPSTTTLDVEAVLTRLVRGDAPLTSPDAGQR
jgi:uncharacterized protein (DUF1501 family)